MNSSNKILSIAVVLLLLVNVALVIFIIKGKGKSAPRKGKDPFTMMVKELDMSDQQQTDYKAQKEEHLKTIRPLFDSLRSAKTAFFSLIKDPNVNDSTVADYSRKITEQQAVIDKYTFSHFKRVRALFTPAQQPKFDAFVQKMMQRGRRDSSNRK